MQWGDISDVTERLIGILALTVFLVGLYLLIVVRRPISRTTTLDSIFFRSDLCVVGDSNAHSGFVGNLCGTFYLGGVLDKIEADTSNVLPRCSVG